MLDPPPCCELHAPSYQYPPTRYMGSKQHILNVLRTVVGSGHGRRALDAFSGSGCVAYMLKSAGFQVTTNDYLAYSYTLAHALVENSSVQLEPDDISFLISKNSSARTLFQQTYHGLYFPPAEEAWLDNVLSNVWTLSGYKRSLALAALSRACIKKRPRGVFTYVGDRYNDGRRDLRLSLEQHFVEAATLFNAAIHPNGRTNQALWGNVFDITVEADLVYLDPPYYTPHSDNDYLRRYHVLEGMCRNWEGVEVLHHTKTRKLRKIPTPFDSRRQVYEAFARLLSKFAHCQIILSYSSNGLPTRDELREMLTSCGKRVDIVEIPHQYSYGTHAHKPRNCNNRVQEYIFIAH